MINLGATLHLPADAIPTISALASKRLPALRSREMSGPFAVADVYEGTPRWFVSIPSIPEWLNRLQPTSAIRFYPTVTFGDDGAEGAIPAMLADIPLAVRYLPFSEVPEEHRVFPFARTTGVIPPTTQSGERHDGRAPSLSVIVSVRDGVADFANFCSSLATQTIAQDLELIVVNNRSSKPSLDAVRQLTAAYFPGRTRILEYDAPFNHSAQTNLGADLATGEHLLIANSDVILLDIRTLEVLIDIAQEPSVASASCTLVHEKGANSSLRLRSAGVFPVELSLFGRPHLSFAEIDCGTVLPNATFPVVANSFALAVIRKSVWLDLAGLNAASFPTDYNDVDFGLRALEKGYFHICTTGIAAYHSGRASRGAASDVHSSRYLTHLPMDRMMQHCTVLRKLPA